MSQGTALNAPIRIRAIRAVTLPIKNAPVPLIAHVMMAKSAIVVVLVRAAAIKSSRCRMFVRHNEHPPFNPGIRMKKLTIGEVAKRSGISIDAIRFYEREKLLLPTERKVSGYRLFDTSILETISFIRNAKELGFALSEIADLLALRKNPKAISSCIKQKTSEKIAAIDDKIAKLQEIRAELAALNTSCSGQGLASECPILEGIAHKGPHA